MFWNQNTTHQTTDKCFGIKTQHIKQLINVLESKHNTSNTREMFWNQNTTHQTHEKCFGIRTEHIKQLIPNHLAHEEGSKHRCQDTT
jgi:hypothetical protein